jgi:hypothetical protein
LPTREGEPERDISAKPQPGARDEGQPVKCTTTREGEPEKSRLGLGIFGLGRHQGRAGEGRAARKESKRTADVAGDNDSTVVTATVRR